MADFTIFLQYFVKWDPVLRIFLNKMGPMSKDFCWKSNPFGLHIPVGLNMWAPPPPPGQLLPCERKDSGKERHYTSSLFSLQLSAIYFNSSKSTKFIDSYNMVILFLNLNLKKETLEGNDAQGTMFNDDAHKTRRVWLFTLLHHMMLMTSSSSACFTILI